MIVLHSKKAKKMKKLVLVAAVAIVAVSFASCGNKAANVDQATADSLRMDSIAKAQAELEAAADTVVVDSAVVAE